MIKYLLDLLSKISIAAQYLLLPFNHTSKRLKGNRGRFTSKLVSFMLTLKMCHTKPCLYYCWYNLQQYYFLCSLLFMYYCLWLNTLPLTSRPNRPGWSGLAFAASKLIWWLRTVPGCTMIHTVQGITRKYRFTKHKNIFCGSTSFMSFISLALFKTVFARYQKSLQKGFSVSIFWIKLQCVFHLTCIPC